MWLSIIPTGCVCVMTDMSHRPAAQASPLCLLPFSVYQGALETVYSGVLPVPVFLSSVLWYRVVVHVSRASRVLKVILVEAQHRWVITEHTISTQKSLLAALLWLHNSEAHRHFHNVEKQQQSIKKFCYPPSVSIANALQPYQRV